MDRVLERDLKERGKPKKQAEKDFTKSWRIYYDKNKNKNKKINKNNFTFQNQTNIDPVLKKIFNLKS